MAKYDRKLKAVINASSSGDNTVIAAPGAGMHIVIDHFTMISASAVSVVLKDGSTAYSGAMPLGTSGTIVYDNTNDEQDKSEMELADNAAWVINLSGAVAVTGFVLYRIVGEV